MRLPPSLRSRSHLAFEMPSFYVPEESLACEARVSRLRNRGLGLYQVAILSIAGCGLTIKMSTPQMASSFNCRLGMSVALIDQRGFDWHGTNFKIHSPYLHFRQASDSKRLVSSSPQGLFLSSRLEHKPFLKNITDFHQFHP